MNEIISIVGLIVSLLPLIILPLKIRAGILHYFSLYIFLVLYYSSLAIYTFVNNDYITPFLYLFEMLFLLNMYRTYLKKELFFALPVIFYFNDIAVMLSFYFTTFNLVEIFKSALKGAKISSLVLFSLLFFEIGVILQIMWIFHFHQYVNVFTQILFLLGTVLFIIPALRVAYEEEKI